MIRIKDVMLATLLLVGWGVSPKGLEAYGLLERLAGAGRLAVGGEVARLHDEADVAARLANGSLNPYRADHDHPAMRAPTSRQFE